MSDKFAFDDVSDSKETCETCEAALAVLTTQINELVLEGKLDSRCAAKLAKRLKKEADAISESGNATKPGREQLKKAFNAIDTTLLDHDARLLVTTNAALRASDGGAGTVQSQ
jgi:hypothetical protein